MGTFLEYDSNITSWGVRSYLQIRVQLDVRVPLKRRKKIIFPNGGFTYVCFKYERLTLFCFYCGRLGHSDSFCQIRMVREEEPGMMGWDLSL